MKQHILAHTSLYIHLTASNLMSNFTQLVAGMPKRLHFTDWYFTVRIIADKESGKTKPVKTLVFWVDEENGEDVARTFSIMSKKLVSHLITFLPDKKYTNYDFIFTEMGAGHYKDWNIQPILRPDPVPLSEREESFDAKKLIEKLWEAI